MTPEEHVAPITDAENKLHDKPEEAKSTAQQVVAELRTNTWATNLFTAPVALRLVKLVRRVDDEKLAQEVLSKALGVYPRNPEFVRQQHYLFSDHNKYDQALAWFQGIVTTAPPVANEIRVAALTGAGAALRNLRRFDQATKTFQEALAASGGVASGELLQEQGWLAFYQRFYDEAFKKFQEAAGKLADDEEQHWTRVGLLASRRLLDRLPSANQQENARKLVASWEQAQVPHDDIIDVFVDCSRLLEDLNLYPAALDDAEHLVEFDNDFADGVYFKIGALKWLRRYAEAENTFRDAPERIQTNMQVWGERANVFYEQKQFRQAYLCTSGKVFDGRELTEAEQALKERLSTNTEAREWTSVALRKMRQLNDARAVITDALDRLGPTTNFLGELGAIYYAERDYQKAIESFDRALELNPYETFCLQWRVASLRKQGKQETAQEQLNAALDKAPYGTRLWEENGWLAFDRDEFEDAIKYFDKATELDPYVITRQLAKIEALIRLDRSDEALDVIKKLDEQFPNDAEIMEQRCWFHMRFGQLDAARDQVIKLRETYPESALGLNALGGYELATRNFNGAAAAFREAINRVGYEPQYHVNLASTLLRQVKSPSESARLETPRRDDLIAQAKAICATALKLDQYHAKAWGCRGVIAFKEGEFIDAESYFRKSIALSSSEGSHIELAALYCQMGRYDDATKELNTALSLNKRDARAYIELANVAVSKGDTKEAIKYCRQAVFVEPKNPETHRALAVALIRAEQYEEAEVRVREALNTLAPAKPWRLRLLLAQILVRAGDMMNKDRKKKDLDLYEEALNVVNDARNECGQNAELFFHAGIVQQRLEDYATSVKSFTECVKLNPQRYEAERYGRITQTALEQQRRAFKVNVLYSYLLVVICAGLLVVLWGARLTGKTHTVQQPVANSQATTTIQEPVVSDTLLNVMTPILLGMLTVAALLPNLSKLKLPGFEAEISDPKAPDPDISSGPRGDIKFGSSLTSVDIDPR